MKITEHVRPPRSLTMELIAEPLTVWLTKTVEMQISRGDVLKDVAKAVGEHWPGLAKDELRRLVAFWFALGERRAKKKSGPWTLGELDVSPKRRYLRY